MTNPEAKAQYEGAILNQLVKNAEKLAVIENEFGQIKPKINTLEQKVDKIYSVLSTVKWLSITIFVGIIVNIFSQPILSILFKH